MISVMMWSCIIPLSLIIIDDLPVHCFSRDRNIHKFVDSIPSCVHQACCIDQCCHLLHCYSMLALISEFKHIANISDKQKNKNEQLNKQKPHDMGF